MIINCGVWVRGKIGLQGVSDMGGRGCQGWEELQLIRSALSPEVVARGTRFARSHYSLCHCRRLEFQKVFEWLNGWMDCCCRTACVHNALRRVTPSHHHHYHHLCHCTVQAVTLNRKMLRVWMKRWEVQRKPIVLSAAVFDLLGRTNERTKVLDDSWRNIYSSLGASMRIRRWKRRTKKMSTGTASVESLHCHCRSVIRRTCWFFTGKPEVDQTTASGLSRREPIREKIKK